MSINTGQVVDTIKLNPSMRKHLVEQLHREFIVEWLRESTPLLAAGMAVSVVLIGAAALLFGIPFYLPKALLIAAIILAAVWGAFLFPIPKRKDIEDTVDALLTMDRLRDQQ